MAGSYNESMRRKWYALSAALGFLAACRGTPVVTHEPDQVAQVRPAEGDRPAYRGARTDLDVTDLIGKGGS